MKIYYKQSDGTTIIKALRDAEVFWEDLSQMVSYDVLDIHELSPDNKTICDDVLRTINHNQVDDVGDPKYYIDTGVLHEKPGWIPIREES